MGPFLFSRTLIVVRLLWFDPNFRLFMILFSDTNYCESKKLPHLAKTLCASVFHRPHPSPDTEKGAVAAIRKWLDQNGVRP